MRRLCQDGDPRNNDFFGTQHESDSLQINFRYGGDVKGLRNRLDYIQGMGFRAIYIAGTIFVRRRSTPHVVERLMN